MNLEELNTSQIILLTLLTSFVTSIATGIITVSLVNQAPPVVTDTIHKVIEKTVEKVVPGEQKTTVIEKINTVIVSPEDFVMNAVAENLESLTRIFTLDEKGEKQFVGSGVILSKTGHILADKDDFVVVTKTDKETSSKTTTENKKEYFISYKGQDIKLVADTFDFSGNLICLTPQLATDAKEIVFKPIVIGNANNLKLGQAVVAIGGEETNIVLTGIISNLIRDKVLVKSVKEVPASTDEQNKTEETKKAELEYEIIITQINTNLEEQIPMKLLLNLDGEVIGVKSVADFFTPINLIQKDLENFLQNKTIATKIID